MPPTDPTGLAAFDGIVMRSSHTGRIRERMMRDGSVFALDGSEVNVEPDTICIHGDEPGAASFARELRALLTRLGVGLRAPG